jgi:hypothetical protein
VGEGKDEEWKGADGSKCLVFGSAGDRDRCGQLIASDITLKRNSWRIPRGMVDVAAGEVNHNGVGDWKVGQIKVEKADPGPNKGPQIQANRFAHGHLFEGLESEKRPADGAPNVGGRCFGIEPVQVESFCGTEVAVESWLGLGSRCPNACIGASCLLLCDC